MSTESVITLASAGLAFMASLIATAVSAYSVSLRRFAEQRWWDRKADAYSRIIEALSNLVYYHEEHYDAELEHRDIPAGRKAEIDQYWKKSYSELKKATAVGAFLISPDADRALRRMWQQRGKDVNPNDWFGLIESDYVTARDCLKDLVAAAKQDLRAPSSWGVQG